MLLKSGSQDSLSADVVEHSNTLLLGRFTSPDKLQALKPFFAECSFRQIPLGFSLLDRHAPVAVAHWARFDNLLPRVAEANWHVLGRLTVVQQDIE